MIDWCVGVLVSLLVLHWHLTQGSVAPRGTVTRSLQPTKPVRALATKPRSASRRVRPPWLLWPHAWAQQRFGELHDSRAEGARDEEDLLAAADTPAAGSSAARAALLSGFRWYLCSTQPLSQRCTTRERATTGGMRFHRSSLFQRVWWRSCHVLPTPLCACPVLLITRPLVSSASLCVSYNFVRNGYHVSICGNESGPAQLSEAHDDRPPRSLALCSRGGACRRVSAAAARRGGRLHRVLLPHRTHPRPTGPTRHGSNS